MPKVEMEIPQNRQEDMLVGALEGGSNYWYWLSDEATAIIEKHQENERMPLAIAMFKAILAGETIPVNDAENPNEKLGEINLKSIAEGEEIMAAKHSRHYIDIINEEDDADTADVWFQLCVLKEVVYG